MWLSKTIHRVGHNTSIGDKVVISNVTTLAAGIPVSTNIGMNNLLIDLTA